MRRVRIRRSYREPVPKTDPPTFEQRREAGGPTGPFLPQERAFIVADIAHHTYTGYPLRKTDWFSDKFPVYPAYQPNEWEKTVIEEKSYLVVRSVFLEYLEDELGDSYFLQKEEEVVLQMIEAYIFDRDYSGINFAKWRGDQLRDNDEVNAPYAGEDHTDTEA